MNKSRSIENLLRDDSLSADAFFNTPAISAQVRSHLPHFLKYVRTHRAFAERMLTLCFNIPTQALEDPLCKAASFAVCQVFGSEEESLAELFFEVEGKPQQSEITEEVQGIQSQAERLFRLDSDEQEPNKNREVEILGEEMVGLSLQILQEPTRNESCLGYLQKFFSFLLRHSPSAVLTYFQQRPDTLQLLLTNLRYSSIGMLLAQILAAEDREKVYRFEALKRKILEDALELIFEGLDDLSFFQGAMVFLEEVLNTAKQSYYEYFEDFKRVSNHLVSDPVLSRFHAQLAKLKERSFSNSSRFLQYLFTRINSEAEDNRQYHRESEVSMDFQIDRFVDGLEDLLLLVPKTAAFASLTRIHYLSFLQALLNSQTVKSTPFALDSPGFLALLDAYRSQSAGGMLKGKIYSLVNLLLSRATQTELETFITTHPELYEKYFPTITGANYANTRTYNRNEAAGFDVSLIGQLTRKEQGRLAAASKALGKDLKRICKKYDTKIASFQNSTAVLAEEEGWGMHSETVKNEGSTGFALNLVGKNSISIPFLQLPEKFNNLESKQRKNEPEPANERCNGIEKDIFVEESEEVDIIVEDKLTIEIKEKMVIVNHQGNISETIIRKKEELNPSPVVIDLDKIGSPFKQDQLNLVIRKVQSIEITEEQTKVMEIAKDFQKQATAESSNAKESVTDAKDKSIIEMKTKGKDEAEKSKFYARHLLIFA